MKITTRDVVGYEGRYSVSQCGTVYSMNYRRTGRVKALCSCPHPGGYVLVSLGKRGKIRKEKVHRVVAIAFVPNPSKKPEVNHKDGDKKNNNVSNLEWVTRKENASHGYKNGFLRNPPTGHGEAASNSKLNNHQVIQIKNLLLEKRVRQVDIAKKFNVGITAIERIRSGRTWSHIG